MEENKEGIFNKEYDISTILIIFPVLILIGKFIRWTILKSVLVDMSIGHGMIGKILNESGGLISFAESGMSDAAGNASVFFRWINFFNLQSTVGFEVFISFIWNFIVLFLILKCVEKLDFWQFSFIALSVIVLNIWDFCLAKEPVQFLFFLAIFFIIVGKDLNSYLKVILSTIVLLISVIYYRNYYILMIAFSGIILLIGEKWLLKKDTISFKDVVKLVAILSFSYLIMISILKIIDSESYSEIIRVRTRIGLAHTQMVNIFKSENIVIFTLDYFIMIFRMLFPVEILVGIKYVPYVAYQIMLSCFFIIKMTKIKEKNYSQRLALYLYLAFLLTSATFEPDFGSWVRHEAAIFPILMIITECIIPEERKEEIISD